MKLSIFSTSVKFELQNSNLTWFNLLHYEVGKKQSHIRQRACFGHSFLNDKY